MQVPSETTVVWRPEPQKSVSIRGQEQSFVFDGEVDGFVRAQVQDPHNFVSNFAQIQAFFREDDNRMNMAAMKLDGGAKTTPLDMGTQESWTASFDDKYQFQATSPSGEQRLLLSQSGIELHTQPAGQTYEHELRGSWNFKTELLRTDHERLNTFA